MQERCFQFRYLLRMIISTLNHNLILALFKSHNLPKKNSSTVLKLAKIKYLPPVQENTRKIFTREKSYDWKGISIPHKITTLGTYSIATDVKRNVLFALLPLQDCERYFTSCLHHHTKHSQQKYQTLLQFQMVVEIHYILRSDNFHFKHLPQQV